MEDKKVLKTVIRNGVTFDNYPVYVSEAYGDSYLMKHEELAEQIASCIPQAWRKAARFDCNLIAEFQDDMDETSEDEQRLLSKFERWMSRHN
ncbi:MULTISPECIES: hypothetical protein [Alicyclobacillus]|uniref:Uncharacterized protein n=2 Tax=Alicyclobacillus TaxID=29330 RepID=C8WYB9_ALIAD|nr:MULTISPECIES: hypothetical protein [Alicyclobacillus]ACV60013.1 hypothetical protein Aaci_3010 [Alicyclobacillus acidocaldarius subsp. acidocaldarius DSM 446]SIT11238.1 hypothetical protein SAMN05421799_11455 [Alicyclobacillus vulcanalis]